MDISKGYKNVFEAFEQPDIAQNLKHRAELMIAIELRIEGMTQKEAAQRLGVSQPRVSDLRTGKIEKFTIDMLINMLARLDTHVTLRVPKFRRSAGVRRGNPKKAAAQGGTSSE